MKHTNTTLKNATATKTTRQKVAAVLTDAAEVAHSFNQQRSEVVIAASGITAIVLFVFLYCFCCRRRAGYVRVAVTQEMNGVGSVGSVGGMGNVGGMSGMSGMGSVSATSEFNELPLVTLPGQVSGEYGRV